MPVANLIILFHLIMCLFIKHKFSIYVENNSMFAYVFYLFIYLLDTIMAEKLVLKMSKSYKCIDQYDAKWNKCARQRNLACVLFYCKFSIYVTLLFMYILSENYKRVFCNNTKSLANKTTTTSSMSLTYSSR